MKNENKILIRGPQDLAKLLNRVEFLQRLPLEKRLAEGKDLKREIGRVLREKGPLLELLDALDEVRFIVQKAAEGKRFLARIT